MVSAFVLIRIFLPFDIGISIHAVFIDQAFCSEDIPPLITCSYPSPTGSIDYQAKNNRHQRNTADNHKDRANIHHHGIYHSHCPPSCTVVYFQISVFSFLSPSMVIRSCAHSSSRRRSSASIGATSSAGISDIISKILWVILNKYGLFSLCTNASRLMYSAIVSTSVHLGHRYKLKNRVHNRPVNSRLQTAFVFEHNRHFR
nr:MAG TPA: hypothetical protein [Caudoviricetes sp.]